MALPVFGGISGWTRTMSIMRQGAGHDPVDHVRGAGGFQGTRDLVQRGAGGHHIVDHGDARTDQRARAAKDGAHVALPLGVGQLDLWRRVARALAKRELQAVLAQMPRDFRRLVVAAAPEPLPGQGNRHDAIDAPGIELVGEHSGEQRRERQLAAPYGEGARAFLKVYADSARSDADHADRLRKAGVRRSPIDGLPVSLKDLFDVAGDVTRAGSKVLAIEAKKDAAAVARLRAAGAIFVGRTNMVEFAFGGVGLNPHYGTPRNPWDRQAARVPGGSSSGPAVAQAQGMCAMALGSDTRGSIRGPAALFGVVGFKPTARRVPRAGAFPLSYTLDSVGPLANTLAVCAG